LLCFICYSMWSLGSGYVRISSVIQSGTLLISQKKGEGTFSSQENGLDTATLLVLPSPVQWDTSGWVAPDPSTDRQNTRERKNVEDTCKWGPGWTTYFVKRPDPSGPARGNRRRASFTGDTTQCDGQRWRRRGSVWAGQHRRPRRRSTTATPFCLSVPPATATMRWYSARDTTSLVYSVVLVCFFSSFQIHGWRQRIIMLWHWRPRRSSTLSIRNCPPPDL
jgi:hypothetical protein